MNGSIESIQTIHSHIGVIKQFTIHHRFTTIFGIIGIPTYNL
jgi:hypothetical protein